MIGVAPLDSTAMTIKTMHSWGRPAWVAALPALLCGLRIGLADMIVGTGGDVLVGRIVEETPTELKLLIGDASGRRKATVSQEEVAILYQGFDELTEIDACTEPDKLTAWTESYYYGGLDITAKRCLKRALALKASIGDAPMAGPLRGTDEKTKQAADLALFWNQVVIEQRKATLQKRDAPGHLALAKWARTAGLTDKAGYYLRRAWSLDRGLREIPQLAEKWAVALEHWAQIDLSPVLDGPIITSSIRDEGSLVKAEQDMVFVTLPVRYDPEDRGSGAGVEHEGVQQLWKNSIRGRDAKGFYGVRHLSAVGGKLRLEGMELEPIYERLELKPGEGARRLVELRNQYAPRVEPPVASGETRPPRTARRPRPRVESIKDRATGWAAIILEVPRSSRELEIEWSDGARELLDLDFVRQSPEVSPQKMRASGKREKQSDDFMGVENDEQGWASSPPIKKTIQYLSGPSPAIAALAIERLSRIRQALAKTSGEDAEEALEAWAWAVDEAVLEAARRTEERVRLAAWRYFCTRLESDPGEFIASSTLDLLSAAEPELQAEWVRIIGSGLRLGDWSFQWTQSGGRLTAPGDAAPGPRLDSASPGQQVVVSQSSAAAMLEAILRSENNYVCADALNLLLQMGPAATDWTFLEQASPVAQRRALSSVEDLPDKTTAARIVQALMMSARPEIAHDVAVAAQAIGLRVMNAESAILSQWWSLHPPERKPAFLTILQGLDLGESVYSKSFRDIIAESISAGGLLRAEAWKLLIEQLEYRRANTGEADWQGGDLVRQAAPGLGPFPMMIAPQASDPLVEGVIDAARRGAGTIRVRALAAILAAGYGGAAADCLLNERISDADRGSILRRLFVLRRHRSSLAMWALLGRLLQKPCAANCPAILEQLTRLAAEMREDEQWRIRAALKSTVHFGELDELVDSLTPPASGAVVRWLHVLGHMTPQDQQRLAAAEGRDQRLECLERINMRNGQRLDGRYGVFAIVAHVERLPVQPGSEDHPPADRPRWGIPRRVTVELPPLELKTSEVSDAYIVTWNGAELGKGQVLEQRLPLRAANAYFPVLVTAQDWWALAGFESPGETAIPRADGKREEPSAGLSEPLRLPHRATLENAGPGTMTLEVAGYLRAALAQKRIFGNEDVTAIMPESCKITLRYATFGCFSGCGTQGSPGDGASDSAASRRFLNVMLVMERLD